MSTILSEPTLDKASVEGTVKVTRVLPASATVVWQSLTHPELVSKWFGALTEPLRQDGRAYLDFDDGDFFALQGIRLNPPRSLRYAWRFLDIGPLDMITWEVIPKGSGCVVTVTDTEPERSPEAAQQLRKGWLDFTNRLRKFVTNGTPSRYSVRSDFEASIELPNKIDGVLDLLFEPQIQTQWLPVDLEGLRNGGHFSVPDDDGSMRFQVNNIVWPDSASVEFDLMHNAWLHPTSCHIDLTARRTDSILSVRQGSWKAIAGDDEMQKRERRRFSATWIKALQQARFLIDWRQRSAATADARR